MDRLKLLTELVRLDKMVDPAHKKADRHLKRAEIYLKKSRECISRMKEIANILQIK